MGVGEFKASQSTIVAELRLLIIEVAEMDFDEDSKDLVLDRATGLIEKVDDSVSERELDRIRVDLGRLQIVIRQAVKRGKGLRGRGPRKEQVRLETRAYLNE